MSWSAAVPYRVRKGRVEVALVTSRRRGRWILPKGRIERGETSCVCAAREAHEEAGVVGAVDDEPLCTWRRRRGRRIVVHLMQVSEALEDWPERALRRRRWVPLVEALGLVGERSLEGVLERVVRQLAGIEDRRGAA